MSVPEVIPLCEGYIRRDGKIVLEAHSSSTIVIDGDMMLVVDTSSPQYRERIVVKLEDLGIDPGKVGTVINTHSHIDHVSNNDLFANATVLDGITGMPGNDREIWPGVVMVRTPGHTPESISVFVEGVKNYAIVGDAIPTHDNYLKWVPPFVNFDRELAIESMKRIVQFAQVVVPGHGAPFPVNR